MLGTCAQDPKTAKERATRWEGCLEEEMFDLCLRKKSPPRRQWMDQHEDRQKHTPESQRAFHGHICWRGKSPNILVAGRRGGTKVNTYGHGCFSLGVFPCLECNILAYKAFETSEGFQTEQRSDRMVVLQTHGGESTETA